MTATLSQVHPLVWIALFPLLALVPAFIAYRKGYAFFEAWVVSLIFPPVAFIVILFLPDYKLCRYCLERIKAEASACRHCGRWQVATPDPLAQAPLSQATPAVADGLGEHEQRSPHGAAPVELAADERGDDRHPSRADRVRQPSRRAVAVGAGIIAAVALGVLVLPGAREPLRGAAERSVGAADAAALGSAAAVPIASSAGSAETGAGDMPETLQASILDSDISPAVAPPGAAIEPASGVDPQTGTVRQLQVRLIELGYDPGPVDGIMGAQTQAALRRYKTATGLAPGAPDGQSGVLAGRADPIAAAQNQMQPVSLVPSIMLRD